MKQVRPWSAMHVVPACGLMWMCSQPTSVGRGTTVGFFPATTQPNSALGWGQRQHRWRVGPARLRSGYVDARPRTGRAFELPITRSDILTLLPFPTRGVGIRECLEQSIDLGPASQRLHHGEPVIPFPAARLPQDALRPRHPDSGSNIR